MITLQSIIRTGRRSLQSLGLGAASTVAMLASSGAAMAQPASADPVQEVVVVAQAIRVNLFNSRVIDDYAGNQSAVSTAFPSGAPLYFTVPGRAIFFNLSTAFQ